MGENIDKKQEMINYYDAVAEDYADKYRCGALLNTDKYPNNYIRLQLLLNSMTTKNIRRVIEVGVGEGTPLAVLAKAGIEVWGFDISENMVAKAKDNAQKYGIDPQRIFFGDITDPITYSHVLKNGGPFDGLIAMGVMPHVQNDDFVIANMAALVRNGGTVFVEFRNKLFSLFTFNRLTLEFILDDLLQGVDGTLKQAVAEELKPRLRMDLPPVEMGYEAILARFHNPFEMEDLFHRHGFTDIEFLWYHYHAAPPSLAKEHAELFHKESLALEHEPSGWRGMFLCSAFVIEATKHE